MKQLRIIFWINMISAIIAAATNNTIWGVISVSVMWACLLIKATISALKESESK